MKTPVCNATKAVRQIRAVGCAHETVVARAKTCEHPDLAPELRYQAFNQAIHLHRSFENVAAGLLKTQPLAQDPFFASDFAALRDRYQREHPNDHDPIE